MRGKTSITIIERKVKSARLCPISLNYIPYSSSVMHVPTSSWRHFIIQNETLNPNIGRMHLFHEKEK